MSFNPAELRHWTLSDMPSSPSHFPICLCKSKNPKTTHTRAAATQPDDDHASISPAIKFNELITITASESIAPFVISEYA